MPLATTKGKEFALQKLAERRANKPKQIDNSSLYAGSPLYYYCIACGHVATLLPDEHWDPSTKLCDECRALKDCGWLETSISSLP